MRGVKARFRFCLLALLLLPVAAKADEAADAFNSLFGADLKQVAATPDPADDVALAAKLVAAAETASKQPALLALLCDKAWELGKVHPTGHATAIKAMELLARCVPGRQIACQEKVVIIRQSQYDAARGDERTKAGGALVAAQQDLMDLKADAGDAAGAIECGNRALLVARAVKSDTRDIQARLDQISGLQRTQKQVADLKARLATAPNDAAARAELLRLCLVDLDNPAEAAKYMSDADDAATRKYVPAAARGLDQTPELACLELGDWYRGLAAQAAPAAKGPMLARARAYYERFQSLHTTEDLAGTRAKLGLQRVTEDLAKLGSAASVGGTAPLKSPPDWLHKARAAADAITDGTRKATALVTVARLYAKAGNVPAAQQTLATARGTGGVDLGQTETWQAYGAIAGAQAKAGDTAGAQKTVQDTLAAAADIGDQRKREDAFRNIAYCFAENGCYAGAHAAIERSSEPWMKPYAYWMAGACQIHAGDIAGARQTVELLKNLAAGATDPQQKTNALVELARLQTKMGDAAGARQSVDAAKAAASGASGFSRAYVARALARLGDVAGAKALADTIGGSEQRDFERMYAYSQIAVVQFKAGNVAGANQTVAAAKAIAAMNPKEKASNYATLAHWLTFEGGDKVALAAVRQTVGEALAAAATLGDPDKRAGVYSTVSMAQGSVRDLAGLRQTLDLLKPLVPNAPRAKDFAWYMFIYQLADLGDPGAAKAVLAMAPPGSRWLEKAGSAIAAGQAKGGDFAGARATAAGITDLRDRATAFFNIAEARAKAGDLRGLRSWAESLTDPADTAAACSGAASGLLPQEKIPDLRND